MAVNNIRQVIKSRTSRALLLSVALALLAAWFFLSQASQSTTAVIRLHQLAVEKEMLRRENAQLRYQISLLESSAHLQEEAEKMGFAPPEDAEYLAFDLSSGNEIGPSIEKELTSSATYESPPSMWSQIISHFWILITGQSPALADLGR
ncbi:MAG: hypothetical protein HYX86_03315 [Chloroflexi bacterium]|nr:hypothetical protein [Chloroflexota bacterium]